MVRFWGLAWAGGLAFCCLIWAVGPGTAGAQTSDSALKDRVGQLVEKLDAPKAEQADAAEKALVDLGPKALLLLPKTTKSAERNKRLERIRTKLREAQDQAGLAASKVTIQRKEIRLSEVLRELQKQSGNPINDLRDQEGKEATNPSMDLDLKDVSFLEALDKVAEKGAVSFNFYNGDGAVGVMADPAPKAPFTVYNGPFRAVFRQIAAVRNFQTDEATGSLQFEIVWEPRIRPMLLALKVEDLKIVDDQGRNVEPTVMEESTQVVLRPENPSSEVNIAIKLPDRSAKKLSKVHVKADLTVPAAQKTFKFTNLAKPNVKQKQGDIEVILSSTEVEEQIWKVNITVVYPGEGEAFESYRQGLFNNRIWLQKADGARFEQNGGFNNTASDGGKLGFEYLFVDVPGKPADWQLVYETPSKVLTIPLEFEFKDVSLP